MQIHFYKYVILGGGVVAGYAARQLVEQEIEPGELCIVSAEASLPYERPPLSKGFLAGDQTIDEMLINAPAFYEQHDIQVLLETTVTEVDMQNRRLVTDRDVMIQFEKLLIATGSRVRTLDLPHADLPGIYTLRTVDDARQIAAAMQDAKHVAVIGGGYIGMEVAVALASQDIAVTMVFPEARLMERFFTPEMSAFFQDYYGERGVTFITQAKPTAFSGDGHVAGVELDNGQALEVDFVVAGIGAEPKTDLFENIGLHIHDGIVVNKYLETNWDGIFAAGDVANYYDVIFQVRRRVEHWDNAVQQGTHAAKVMTASRRRDEFIYLRYFFSDVFDLSYEFWGDTRYTDRVVYRGDLSRGSFSVWWLAGNRLDAAFVMNRPNEEREHAPEWIRSRRRVVPSQLQDESMPFDKMTPQLVF